jgi:hypothetical protein
MYLHGMLLKYREDFTYIYTQMYVCFPHVLDYHARLTNLCPELNVARGILVMRTECGPVAESCHIP